MPITNKKQFPEVKWLNPPYQQIGTISGTRPLYLVGREEGFDTPVVVAGDPKGKAEAIYLYELEKFQPMELRITENF